MTPSHALRPGAVLVFARHPEVEEVKTRLASAVGRETARALYRAFLRDGLSAAAQTERRVVLAHGAGPPFAEAALADEVFEQAGESFGARLDAAFAEARRRVPEGPLLVVGADTPHLGPELLESAFAQLDAAPAVLGPAGGGGFHLLGFRGAPVPLANCFEAPGESVAVARALVRAGAPPVLTEFLQDVDVEADLVGVLHELELRRSLGGGWLPAATIAAVRELGLSVEPGQNGAIASARGGGLAQRS